MERLQRILAHAGVASRRSAEEMIRAGRVTVDGQVVTEMGTKANPARSTIRVDGTPIRRQQPRYILLNKPRGYITTTNDERDRRTVLDLVQVKQRVYPVGRLDRATEGLLLLTNDGEIANRVMHPRYGLTKEYHVLTERRPSDMTLQRLREGIKLDGKVIVPDEVRLLREARDGIWLRVDLHEGMTHVVRRLMEAAGIPVERLRRVRIGPLTVTGIPLGAWRDLTPGELAGLIEALKLDRPLSERDRGPQRSRTFHVQRPRPRPASASASAPPSQPAHRARSRPPAGAAARRPERGRPTVESHPTIEETPAGSAGERRPKNSRRRRGEPPAPLPRPKKATNQRDQRLGRAAKGPKDSQRGQTRPAQSGRPRKPEQAATDQRPPRPKQQRRGPAPTNETRSGYDDPSRRRNRRARAREEAKAKSVSRRDRD